MGASYIALECGGLLSAFGFDTTIMVRSILLRGFDQECATKIGDYMKNHGTKFIYGAVPISIEKIENDRRKVVWINPDTKEVIGEDTYDTVVLAVGRSADTKNIGVEQVGIKTMPNGKIICSDDDLTSAANIYAIGDCVHTRPELTPVAIKAGQLLAKRLFGGADELVGYQYIPTTVFTPIEYGCIGYAEEDAIKK